MNSKDKSEDIIFMSTDQFEHLDDAENFVFSHVAYFACQPKRKNLFTGSTRAICNKVGYSPNTVRKAIGSLIEKKFLLKEELVEEKTLKYSYIKKVEHRLRIGEAKFAQDYSEAMEKMIHDIGKKVAFKGVGRDIRFFKVNVGKLRRNNDAPITKADKNLSKHLHKTLMLHGFLYNQRKWDDKRGRESLSRSVPFLSATMQWSQNTVRRVINTLNDIGSIGYSYATKTINFSFVSVIKALYASSKKLKTTLANKNQSLAKIEAAIDVPKRLQGYSPNQTPAEAAAFLESLHSK